MSDNKKNESMRVVLARIEVKQDNFADQLKTHLRHHWAATIALLTSGLSIIGGLIFIIVKAGIPG